MLCVCVRSNQGTSKKTHVSDLSKLIVCTPPLLLSAEVGGGEGGGELLTKFSKKGELHRISIFRGGVVGKEGLTFFRGLSFLQKRLTKI